MRRQAGEHERTREAGHRRVMPTHIARSSTAQRMVSEPALDLDPADGLSSGIGDEESKHAIHNRDQGGNVRAEGGDRPPTPVRVPRHAGRTRDCGLDSRAGTLAENDHPHSTDSETHVTDHHEDFSQNVLVSRISKMGRPGYSRLQQKATWPETTYGQIEIGPVPSRLGAQQKHGAA